jgi:predicted transposase/invertase (TIGR01784 family)
MQANREYQSSVFVSYFKETPERLIELLNAVAKTFFPMDTPVEIKTLDGVLFKERLNDLAFLVAGRLIVLVEHQSTVNLNMPIRFLMYIGRIYEKLLDGSRDLYRTELIKIPKPKFYVLYTGLDPCEDRVELDLASAFMDSDGSEQLNLTVPVYNVNEGHNKEIMERSRSLEEYAAFMGLVRKYRAQNLPLDQALSTAIEHAIREGIMTEYLREHGSEVHNMLYTEYKLEDALEVRYEEGLHKGEQEGKRQGVQEVAQKMIRRNRPPEEISEVTDIPLDEVLRLKAELEGIRQL